MQIHNVHAPLASMFAGRAALAHRASALQPTAASPPDRATAPQAPIVSGAAERSQALKRLHSLGGGTRALVKHAATISSSPTMMPVKGANPAATQPHPGLVTGHDEGILAMTKPSDDAPSKQYELTMAGLLEAWGKNDPAYDLDGDGVVGVSDLLALLAAGGTMKSDKKPNDSLGGLLGDWGKGGSQYDYTGSGSVGVGDLLDFLSKGG